MAAKCRLKKKRKKKKEEEKNNHDLLRFEAESDSP